MSIGTRIRLARKASGLTQSDLAARLDHAHSTVNRWESGQRQPPRAMVVRIAEETDVQVAWLEVGGTPPPALAGMTGEGAPADDPDNTIAFQGMPGAYSQMACLEAHPEMHALPCHTFADAFEAVEDGRAALAMIAIENSLGGRVADVHHLLPDSSLYIVGEHFQPVHHHLLAPKGATLEGLKTVRSHVQALSQCRDFIRELGLRAEDRVDTAGSAKEVAELNDPAVAAIGSALAAEVYGLETLRSRVEDRIGNTTRFIIMARQRLEPDPREGPCLTSIVFTVRSVPAALYKSLGGFATNGVNLIRLESYISVADYSVARFYLEIEGHPSEKRVDTALDELQFYSTKLKILGTYPANPYRDEP